jgi:8-oxo-dGTP pyrophosphatase MutT (NUDIX family)
MAHDAGRDASAKRHFGRALALVQIGGDHQLTAHILGSMSHLASYLGAPDEAVALARQGQAALHAGPANPALEARMFALEARGVAGKDPADPSECARLLLRAEQALEDIPAASVSTWVSHFDEGSLASETTRCLRQLGDLEQARQQAERIISLRPGHRTRSRAFGQLALASVLIAQQEPDRACEIASDVLDATQSLGSYLVISQLIQLQRQLEPYSGNPVVASARGLGGIVSTDGKLYERDSEGWNAYLAEGNAKQARKRVSADAIVRDSSGRILLVDPTYKPDWDLPGGMAEANEPPADALRRELREELGLDIQVGDLLCVDWISPHSPWDDLLNFIFDGGTLNDSDINGLRLVDSELRAFEFCDEGQAKERLRPYVWRRASAALEAMRTGRARYLQDGNA